MTLGIIFGETSTQEFSFLFGDADGERQNQLKSAYVEVNLAEDDSKIVARVIDINTENPLLAKDTAKFYSETSSRGIGFPDLMSRRFTLYQAKCAVIGKYSTTTQKIEPLTQPIKPGQRVELLSEAVLSQLYSDDNPWYLHLGHVETPDRQTQAQVSLRADSIITMHACVFGMTGMGKTTTTAVLLEELMFRGAKTIVFDPHSDYVNLNQMRQDLYNEHLKEKVENCEALMSKISDYRANLKDAWSNLISPWKDFDSSFNAPACEEINTELTTDNIFYRLLNFGAIRDRRLMIDSTLAPEALNSQLDAVIDRILQINLQSDLPHELVNRKLTIQFRAFPTVRMYCTKSPYFTMRLIEAFAGEEFTDPQIGKVIPLIRGNIKDKDSGFMNYLIDKQKGESATVKAIKRILGRASDAIKSLEDRGCQSVDISEFVNAFCAHTGNLSMVSTAIFDLSDLETDEIRRALVYAVMNFIFDEYKSKRLNREQNAHPILFAIEEARTLIPRAETIRGETLPATRLARLGARQIATEGRKMGLGMLVISQKPASVDPLTVSQANTLILHRAINPDDQNYIRNVGESLSTEDLEMLKSVKEGVAIVTGDALKTRMSTLVKVRNRYSEPGTEKPRPIENLWRRDQE